VITDEGLCQFHLLLKLPTVNYFVVYLARTIAGDSKRSRSNRPLSISETDSRGAVADIRSGRLSYMCMHVFPLNFSLHIKLYQMPWICYGEVITRGTNCVRNVLQCIK